jgi:hypothetical protein
MKAVSQSAQELLLVFSRGFSEHLIVLCSPSLMGQSQ